MTDVAEAVKDWVAGALGPEVATAYGEFPEAPVWEGHDFVGWTDSLTDPSGVIGAPQGESDDRLTFYPDEADGEYRIYAAWMQGSGTAEDPYSGFVYHNFHEGRGDDWEDFHVAVGSTLLYGIPNGSDGFVYSFQDESPESFGLVRDGWYIEGVVSSAGELEVWGYFGGFRASPSHMFSIFFDEVSVQLEFLSDPISDGVISYV